MQAKIARIMLRYQFSGWSEGSIQEQRARQEKTARYTRLRADVRCQPVSADGVAAEWIEAPGADRAVLLYLHGGAYALGSINTHRELVARLARAANVRGLALDYRLAPEHPFPAALEDAIAGYRWLLVQGYDPAQILLGGDSAGGGLALATLVALRDAGNPLPAGAVCISPWTDLAHTGASIQSNAGVDPMLTLESSTRYAGYYAGDQELTSPLISPLYADLTGLPPLLIQVGSDEILRDDAARCAEHAQEAGVDVTLEVWNGMFHVFQVVAFLPETKKAVAHIAEFVRQNLSNAE